MSNSPATFQASQDVGITYTGVQKSTHPFYDLNNLPGKHCFRKWQSGEGSRVGDRKGERGGIKGEIVNDRWVRV